MTNCWGLASSCELISSRPGLSRSITSFTTELRGSVVMSFLVRETKHQNKPLIQLSFSFPLLRKPCAVVIPLREASWRRTFNKLLMIFVRCGLMVAADIRSPWSLLFLSNCTPNILISITSLHQDYWSRGWYFRRRLCTKIHHWSRFCCDSFFSWILLKCFLHCFESTLQNWNGWHWTSTTNDSTHHVLKFFWLGCQQVGFWCQCTWFGFLGPYWFDRTTNQEQLWKHVSL